MHVDSVSKFSHHPGHAHEKNTKHHCVNSLSLCKRLWRRGKRRGKYACTCPAPVPTLAPADFSGIWSGSYNGTALSYVVTQTGSSYTMVRTTPLLAGLTYAGKINGNVAAVTGYINGAPAFTNRWTLLDSTTSSMVATGCTPPPGYGCGAPNGTAITLTRPLPAPPPPVVAPYIQTMPIGVFAVSGLGQISLSWPPVIGASSYNIYWGITPNITTASAKITGATSPYTHTGLVAGSTYYYRVSAINAGVESLSDEVFSAVYAGGSPAGIFVPTGSMATARDNHTATLLPNGNVLVAGGSTATAGIFGLTTVVLASVEIFNSSTGTFSVTGNMLTAREGATATLLSNGTVLLTGGKNLAGTPISSAEIYDPITGAFTSTGSMITAHVGHTATLLGNGKVLVSGGYDAGHFYSYISEIYDPVTGVFTATGQMTSPRAGHTATLLPNGNVLIAGRTQGFAVPFNAEIYNPITGVFTVTGSMGGGRVYHSATLLPNGTVLLTGGLPAVTVAEIYNPSTGVFSPSTSMGSPREWHTSVMLSNGNVLFAGGLGNNFPLSTAEIWNSITGLFSATGNMANVRGCGWTQETAAGHTATLLPNGKVLIVGGRDAVGISLATAELFQ